MKVALFLLPFLAVVVFLLIRAEFRKDRRWIYVLKPIATLTVIAAALCSFGEPSYIPVYTGGVLAGLLLSFGGDAALMFPDNRKAFMLGLFVLAHITYAAVFWILGRFSGWDLVSAGLLSAVGALFYTLIRPNLGKMKVPVIVYMAVVSLMVNRSVTVLFAERFGGGGGGLVVTGAVLFYVSDILLAAGRFWKPWRYHRISLAFYYGGQYLIALAASYSA
jgi:uncharacterized membrane protein YhhN